MADGSGYDAVCVAAFMATRADTCLLIVLDGDQGNGFSVNSLNPSVAFELPPVLRKIADSIEGAIPTTALL